MSTCYVCFEECDTVSPCDCKNMPLHDHCLETLRVYRHKECKVCKAAYPPSETPHLLSSSESDEEYEEEEEEQKLPVYWFIFPYAMRPPHYSQRYSECGEFGRAILLSYCLNCIINYEGGMVKWWEIDPVTMWYSFSLYALLLIIARGMCIHYHKDR